MRKIVLLAATIATLLAGCSQLKTSELNPQSLDRCSYQGRVEQSTVGEIYTTIGAECTIKKNDGIQYVQASLSIERRNPDGTWKVVDYDSGIFNGVVTFEDSAVKVVKWPLLQSAAQGNSLSGSNCDRPSDSGVFRGRIDIIQFRSPKSPIKPAYGPPTNYKTPSRYFVCR